MPLCVCHTRMANEAASEDEHFHSDAAHMNCTAAVSELAAGACFAVLGEANALVAFLLADCARLPRAVAVARLRSAFVSDATACQLLDAFLLDAFMTELGAEERAPKRIPGHGGAPQPHAVVASGGGAAAGAGAAVAA